MGVVAFRVARARRRSAQYLQFPALFPAAVIRLASCVDPPKGDG